MKQMISRIVSNDKDVSILVVENGHEIWKSVSLVEYERLVSKMVPKKMKQIRPRMIDKRIIAYSPGATVFNVPEHRRIVSYKGKAYKINFPNAVYVVLHSDSRIISIDAYTYFEWTGKGTDLYDMPMPNMTSSCRMCIGTGDRTITDGDVYQALQNVLDASYSHDHVDNVAKSTSTLKWFGYLKKNSVAPSDLKKPRCKLGDLVD